MGTISSFKIISVLCSSWKIRNNNGSIVDDKRQTKNSSVFGGTEKKACAW